MISDFHNHTRFSGDSEADIDTVIRTAISLNMKELCITDHQDFDYIEDGVRFEIDPLSYYRTLSQYRETYNGKIDLRIGVETGLGKEFASRLHTFVSSVPFDFVIGSSHLVNGTDPYYPVYWENIAPKQAVENYFLSILENLSVCHDFDVYGHLDYVVRYCKAKDFIYSPFDYADLIDLILKKIISCEKGIELNTGGMYKGSRYPNPHPAIIKRYRELGGEIITVGSDAHTPDYLGYRFDYASDLLQECGFHYYCTFKNRTGEFHKL